MKQTHRKKRGREGEEEHEGGGLSPEYLGGKPTDLMPLHFLRANYHIKCEYSKSHRLTRNTHFSLDGYTGSSESFTVINQRNVDQSNYVYLARYLMLSGKDRRKNKSR